MKIIRRIYLLLTLIPLLISGCGGDDINPHEINLPGDFIFPSGASGPLWEVSDSYMTELQNLDIPSDWAWIDIDEETRDKYYHAQLLKQFGDIPEVRYLIAYDLHPGDKTRDQIVAKSEAQYRLFPNRETLKALQQAKELPDFTNPGEPESELEWIQRDPDGYYQYLLEELIKDYGDIPEVYTVARIALKIKQGKRLTADEVQEYEDAVEHLHKSDEQDEEKQDE